MLKNNRIDLCGIGDPVYICSDLIVNYPKYRPKHASEKDERNQK